MVHSARRPARDAHRPEVSRQDRGYARRMETQADADILDRIAGDGLISAQALERARVLAGITPDRSRWIRFLEQAMALGAALLLAAAVVFFVAYNWAEMGRFARLGLIEAAFVAAAVAGIALDPRSLVGRGALFAAIVLLGALLALIGQTYQTGADTWQLFSTWALLALPFAIAAGWAPTWALVLVLADLAIGFFMGLKTGVFGFLVRDGSPFTALAIFNALAAALAEAWRPRDEASVHRLVPRLAATIALAAASVGAMFFIFTERQRPGDLLAVYVACVAACTWAYRFRSVDLLMLAVLCLSGIVVAAAAVGKVVIGNQHEYLGFLLTAAVVIGTSIASAAWIRGIARSQGRSA
jgi:uncharacterized membrane protein